MWGIPDRIIWQVKAAITPNVKPKPTDPPAELISQERFVYLTQFVIDHFEGGYYHPNMKIRMKLSDQKKMGTSGETMFGLDRRHGVQLAIYPEWKEFWAIIDKAGAATRWAHYYRGGPLAPVLKDLTAKIMYRWFSTLFNRYISREAKPHVAGDDRLIIHFSYASWNGEDWFKRFAYALNAAVKKGVTGRQTLYETVIKARSESSNSVIRQHGQRMVKLFAEQNL